VDFSYQKHVHQKKAIPRHEEPKSFITRMYIINYISMIYKQIENTVFFSAD